MGPEGETTMLPSPSGQILPGGGFRRNFEKVDRGLELLSIHGFKAMNHYRIAFYCSVQRERYQANEDLWNYIVCVAMMKPRQQYVDFIRRLYLYDMTRYNTLVDKARKSDHGSAIVNGKLIL